VQVMPSLFDDWTVMREWGGADACLHSRGSWPEWRGRCGRHLMVSYSGRPPGQPVYRCERPNQMLGLPRCFTFGGGRRLGSVLALAL
jgi:hypothetical protein